MSAFPANLWSLGWELSNDFSCIISPEGKTLLWFFHLMFSPGNCYERMLFLELSRQVLYMIWKTKKKKKKLTQSTSQFQPVDEWSEPFPTAGYF